MVNLREAEIKMMEKRAMVMAVIVSIFPVAVPIGQIKEVPSASLKYEPCPENCSCFLKQTDKSFAVDVRCDGKSLSSVPKIIDNYISISILNLSSNSFKNLTLLGYESTTALYLQFCELNSIDEKAFYGFKNLTVLDLSYNFLTSIPPNLFATNHLLDTLYLHDNDLQDTDPNTPFLMGPSTLRILDLQHCKLSNLSSATFSLLPNLEYIDISRNEFLLLDPECLHFLLKLKDIRVENNHWVCGAKFENLLCWIQRNLSSPDIGTLECKRKDNTTERYTPDKTSSLCCSSYETNVTETTTVDPKLSKPIIQKTGNNWWLPFGIGLLVGVFVGFIPCLVFHHRERIFTIITPLLCANQTQYSETHTASRGLGGSTRNSQEAEEDEVNEEENDNETRLTSDSLP
jgi:hypothetical protein